MIILAALLTFALICYIYDNRKTIYRALKSAIDSIYKNVVNGVGYLYNVISEALESSRSGRRYSTYELHHIVGQKDRRAIPTKKFIGTYGISVYNSCNLVTLKKTFHKHLHTNSYFAAVDIVLRQCARSQNTYSKKRSAILTGMIFIGNILSAANSLL